MSSYRVLRGAAPGRLRKAIFQDREHYVTPVVALVEGVFHPRGADAPEYVPAQVLRTAPQGWNGRPCVGPHPTVGNALISANIPNVLEQRSFGTVFNAGMRGTQLHMEAWLDPERCARVGHNA